LATLVFAQHFFKDQQMLLSSFF